MSYNYPTRYGAGQNFMRVHCRGGAPAVMVLTDGGGCGPSLKTCWTCGQPGHEKKACPDNKGKGMKGKGVEDKSVKGKGMKGKSVKGKGMKVEGGKIEDGKDKDENTKDEEAKAEEKKKRKAAKKLRRRANQYAKMEAEVRDKIAKESEIGIKAEP